MLYKLSQPGVPRVYQEFLQINKRYNPIEKHHETEAGTSQNSVSKRATAAVTANHDGVSTSSAIREMQIKAITKYHTHQRRQSW